MKPIYVYPKDQEVVIHLNDDRDKSTAATDPSPHAK